MATANPSGTRTYPTEGHTAASTTTRTEKGISLARGPALILGTILLAVGLYLLYKARTFPPFSNFPNGNVTKDGDFLFGLFGANGWTGMLTAVGGGLLLFGAAQHLLAKTMSLVVGVALGAAAVIALVSGNVLGMAAANGWTKLGWAICAVILLFNTLAPRRRRTVVVADEPVAYDAAAYNRRPATAAEEDAVAAHDEPTVAHRDRALDEEPTVVHRDHALDEEPTVAHSDRALDEEPTVAHDDRALDEEPTVARHGDAPAEIHRD
ncbi:MAG TPA: hypothetical protein VGF68_06165 [Solirubrobacteraceae bacterium]|jgi:hypothetical protein